MPDEPEELNQSCEPQREYWNNIKSPIDDYYMALYTFNTLTHLMGQSNNKERTGLISILTSLSYGCSDYFYRDLSIQFEDDKDSPYFHNTKSTKKALMEYLRKVLDEKPKGVDKTKDTIKFLCDTYSLDSDALDILYFISQYELNRKTREVQQQLMRQAGGSCLLCRQTYETLALLTSKQKHVIEKTITLLLDLSVLIQERHNEYVIALNYPIRHVLADPTLIEKEEDIASQIIGEACITDLRPTDFLHLGGDIKRIKMILKYAFKEKKQGINILFYGDPGTGKTELAKLISRELKTPMYSVKNGNRNDDDPHADRLDYLRLVQGMLKRRKQSANLLFDEAEDIFLYNEQYFFAKSDKTSKVVLNNTLESNYVPTFWITNKIDNLDPAIIRRMTYVVKFDTLPENTRIDIWRKELKKYKFTISEETLSDLVKSYSDIPVSLISNTLETVNMFKGNLDDVRHIIEVKSEAMDIEKKEDENSDRINKYNVELINSDQNIQSLTSNIIKSGNVDFSLCLYGPAGTGKSLYLRQLAKELGMPVLFKRASDLIDMYVGESEKNIAKAFREAKRKKAFLIFDEADSFLRSRGLATKSWEVTQVNEMLTQMEYHEFPFACTTNLMDNMDEASLRRFTFKTKFNYLTGKQVRQAFVEYFGVEPPNTVESIKGLALGDFATVYKKARFLNQLDKPEELVTMLADEVKIKKDKEIDNKILGF